MSHEKKINVKSIPEILEIKRGDYLIVETDASGTRIIDFENFILDETNTTFEPLLSTLKTDIKSLSAITVSVSATSVELNTLVTQVSGLTGLDWRDVWSASATYEVLDSVFYEKSSFVAVADNTNQAPIVAGALNSGYWGYLAKGATVTLSAYGDLSIGDGAGSSKRLEVGASGYVLKSQGPAADPIWAQEDTGSGRNYCSKLSIGSYTSNNTNDSFHYVMADGDVRGSGEGYGLGAGFNESYDHETYNPQPVTLPADYDRQSADHTVKDVYRGYYQTFILTEGGHVYSAGQNGVGQSGIGSTTVTYTFQKITFPDSGVKIREIVMSTDDGSSGATNYFIAEGHGSAPNDGRVYACGDNNSGQIGDGTTTDRTSPTRVGSLVGVEKLWAWGGTDTSTFIRLSGGDFYAWGDVAYNGNRGVHAADGSVAANVLAPVKQGTDGFKPGDATAPYGLHGVEDMRVHRSSNGSDYYSSTFALLTSGHVYGIGYNDGSLQMGVGHSTNNVTLFTVIPSVSAAYALDTHPGSTVSSAIATCSAIEGGSWNSTTMIYEGFTDQTSVSGVKLIGWGRNDEGELGDGTETAFPVPRIMNNYLPTALCASVSSVICEKHSRSNHGAVTYIRDLSGYYWFAGHNGYGLDTQNDGGTSTANVTTFKKISLPVHPSEIKDFQVVISWFASAGHYMSAILLTHNGRVFNNGYGQGWLFGNGYNASAQSNHAKSSWHQVRF